MAADYYHEKCTFVVGFNCRNRKNKNIHSKQRNDRHLDWLKQTYCVGRAIKQFSISFENFPGWANLFPSWQWFDESISPNIDEQLNIAFRVPIFRPNSFHALLFVGWLAPEAHKFTCTLFIGVVQQAFDFTGKLLWMNNNHVEIVILLVKVFIHS